MPSVTFDQSLEKQGVSVSVNNLALASAPLLLTSPIRILPALRLAAPSFWL
jgi:hypothetical protein